MDFKELASENRLLIEGRLSPLQGSRFQPTGFPDLGPATYDYQNQRMLLVESAQSMANRMEAVCWDEVRNDWVDVLRGLPYVRVNRADGTFLISSVQESHRLNSPYILEGKDDTFVKALKKELGTDDKVPVDLRKLAKILLKYDINSLIHGVFLAKKEIAGGRMRLPRILTSFIEASDVNVAASGGVKLDKVDPKGDAKKGFGNVPFHRDEYTGNIRIFFNLDLAQVRGFGFDEAAQNLLIGFSLFKIQSVVHNGMRLRTACDLELDKEGLIVKRPEGFKLPSLTELEKSLPGLITAASGHFANGAVTQVKYEG